MLATVNCPNCLAPVLSPPHMQGKPVGCPHCSHTFWLPGLRNDQELVASPPRAEVMAAPQVIVVEREPITTRVDRLKPTDWFTRTLAVGAGVLVLLIPMLLWMSGLMSGKADEKPTITPELTNRALKVVQPHLEDAGIETFADNARIVVRGEYILLTGPAIGRDDRIHRVEAFLRVADLGSKQHFQMEILEVDGEQCFP